MKFKDYATIWITKHVSKSDLYGSCIRECVTQLIDLLIAQRHSGASFSLTVSHLARLIRDYEDQEPL